MITALVQFKLPQPVTREKAQEIFLSTAPKYRATPGLLRKYYVLSQDGGTARSRMVAAFGADDAELRMHLIVRMPVAGG